MTTYDYGQNDATLIAPTSIRRSLRSNSGVLRSSLSGVTQTIARSGSRWEIEVTWETLTGNQYKAIVAFFRRLNGAEHRVRIHTWDLLKTGDWGGTPVVDGASQTGSALNVRGADISTTGWAKSGDFFYYNAGGKSELKQVTADADSDGSGDVTLAIIPPIRTSPSDAAALHHSGNVYGQYILTSPVEAAANARRAQNDGLLIGDLSLSFVEDI